MPRTKRAPSAASPRPRRSRPPRIGLALGSGAARGWAHIGVLRELEAAGVSPDVVSGTSIGALVGAAWCAGELDALERWARSLEWRTVLGLFDLTFSGGGLIRARRLFDAFREHVPDRPIESLPRAFGAVATDLASGQEVWLREGSMLEAVRASVALPGLVAPVREGGRWLVDGGLVNPVPVSLCRALGADVVIAVDLNTALLGRRLRPATLEPPGDEEEPAEAVSPVTSRNLRTILRGLAADLRSRFLGEDADERDDAPTIYDVTANTINIMQVRITRSRMAGDPPELLFAPKLARFGLLDFDRAAEAIEEGRRAVAQALAPGAPAWMR